jgi:hypothetical protein
MHSLIWLAHHSWVDTCPFQRLLLGQASLSEAMHAGPHMVIADGCHELLRWWQLYYL